jgi:hypothetical protein
MSKSAHYIFLFANLLICTFAHSQSVYISRYIGLNYLTDPVYQVDIFNPSDQTVSLGNYMLVSRQFVAKLPANTRLEAYSKLSLGKHNRLQLELPFSKIQDFIIRIPKENELGDYLVLIDPRGKIVDAFYFGPRRSVAFLPDAGELITFSNEQIPFEVPDESKPIWNYLPISPDPALAFVRIRGRWEVSSRQRNTLPATAFGPLEAKYVQGIVTINGESRFERDCLPHQLERSENGRNFERIHRFTNTQNTEETTSYRYYDDGVAPNKRYFYRLKNEDKFGFSIFSNLVEVRTDDLPGDFSLEVFQSNPGGNVNVRFSTRQARRVRIKILDEQFRELDLLFYDNLAENSQQLIKYEPNLPPGKYLILADVGERRVFETLIISE